MKKIIILTLLASGMLLKLSFANANLTIIETSNAQCQNVKLYGRSILSMDYSKMNKKDITEVLSILSSAHDLQPGFLVSTAFILNFTTQVRETPEEAIEAALNDLCKLSIIPGVNIIKDTPVGPIGRLSGSNATVVE